MLSNSGGDEYGGIHGGRAGDQTGGEWNIRPWYNYPWRCVLRYPNSDVRKKIAELGRKAANNNNVGYDQYQRLTYWTELQKVNYDPSKITTPCESDCSAGVIANVRAVGYIFNIDALKNIGASYTGNMRSSFSAAGFQVLTESKYLTSDKYLLEGDILLNDTYHTATNLDDGSAISPSTTTPVAPSKTNDQIVEEVLKGFWGVGDDRKNRLTAAGYNYDVIQYLINTRLANQNSQTPNTSIPNTSDSNKSVDDVAQEVLDGKWGNGDDRRKRLTAAGYNYNEVQAAVNRKLSNKKTVTQIAQEVLDGKWGNGHVRKSKLEAAGYNYLQVQAKVNELIKLR